MTTLRHVSDVDTWGGPDRNYYEFVVISVLLGLVGGDHIYLRSFKTAGLKALVNLCTFGSWYWWDLLQIFTNGEVVKTEGLASPLDWIRNIGRGVFVDKAKDPTEYVSQKSYVVFALCAVFFGFFAADKFYMGDYVAGVAKLVLCLNIFTFLIGWVWAGYDAWNAVFSEKEILEQGIPNAPGIGWLLPRVSGEAFKLKPKREGIVASVLGSMGVSEGNPLAAWIRWILCLLGMSSGSQTCEKPTYKAPTPVTETKEANQGNQVKEAKESNEAKEANQGNQAKEAKNTVTPNNTVHAVSPVQRGGAYEEPSGPGPVVAGALTAVVVAAGLKSTYDFISQQYQ